MVARKGFSVVEIVVAAALIAVIVTAAAGAWQLYLKMTNQSTGLTNAALLAEEGSEAITLLRDQSWNSNIASLSLNTPYYLYYSSTTANYSLAASPVIIMGQYVRSITLSAVNRDSSTFNITSTSTSCGINCDSNTRDVLISVSFASSSVPLVQSEILIHNVFNN